MDTNIIKECNDKSLNENAPFPEIVMKLAAAGVERYIADLVGIQKLYYSTDESFTHSMGVNLPKVEKTFCAETVQKAVKDIQQKKIDYKAFLNIITEAGCTHYEVFILGKKAIYFGREGCQYIEHFPK